MTPSESAPTVPATAREVHLVRRPRGHAVPGDFAVVSTPVARPGPGQVLVRTLAFSVDPYMRGRLDDAPSYAPPFALGEPMSGGAIGEVVDPGDSGLEVGAVVEHGLGWREIALVDASAVRPVDPAGLPLTAFLGVLGMTGLTAWVGLVDVAAMREGDTVFVSGAAGAVGSVAGQLARARGAARVIGSAGGPDKARHLVADLGYDAGLDHRAGDLSGQLAAAAPGGIDVYFDNVGGDHLRAAIASANQHARMALCGSISGYDAAAPAPGPDNLSSIVGKRLRLEGFIVSDFVDRRAEFRTEVSGLVADGRIVARETVSRGIDSAIGAFLGLFTGANTGKAVVVLADTSSSGVPVTAG